MEQTLINNDLFIRKVVMEPLRNELENQAVTQVHTSGHHIKNLKSKEERQNRRWTFFVKEQSLLDTLYLAAH